MQKMQALKKKIDNTVDLQSVVKTMKALAAVSIHQYQQAVESIAEYNRTIEMGLRILFMHRKPQFKQRSTAKPVPAAVVFGSQQGMCGQFNEKLLSFMESFFTDRFENIPKSDISIICVGPRMSGLLADSGFPVEIEREYPGSVEGVTPVLYEILNDIEQWREHNGITRMTVFHNAPKSGTSYTPAWKDLLPVNRQWLKKILDEPWPTRQVPMFVPDWELLYSQLVQQYFYVVLYRSFIESQASENASRLASMQTAEKNIKEKLDELRAQFNHQRQSAITSEMLDIVAGFEALKTEEEQYI